MPDPVCEALIFCELDIIEAQTSKHTLVGVFESLSGTSFPFKADTFFVHAIIANWVSSPDGGFLALNVKNSEIGSIIGSVGIPLAKVQQPSKNPTTITARFCFRSMAFPTAGAYQVELLLDDELIGSRILEIRSEITARQQAPAPASPRSSAKIVMRGDAPAGNESASGLSEQQTAIMAAVKRAVVGQKASDALIGLKMAAQEVNHRLMTVLKDQRGVHIQTLLVILGSLAGFACQMGLREELIKTGAEPEMGVFMIVDGSDGRRYFFGDRLNKLLVEDTYSIWSLAAAAARTLGCAALPDVNEMFKHVVATIGSDKFGIPRIPEGNGVVELPINWVKGLWPRILPAILPFCDKPTEWPIAFAVAIQLSILSGKDVIDPALAVTIVMECAIPMSKVDLPEFSDLPLS